MLYTKSWFSFENENLKDKPLGILINKRKEEKKDASRKGKREDGREAKNGEEEMQKQRDEKEKLMWRRCEEET